MTATSTLIEALRRAENDIDRAFEILRKSRWAEARSATRILARLRRNHPGAVRAEYIGRCSFGPVPYTLALDYVNSDHEVIGSEPWVGNKPSDYAAEMYFREHAPPGAKYARLVRDDGRTILIAPPIRGSAPTPLAAP